MNIGPVTLPNIENIPGLLGMQNLSQGMALGSMLFWDKMMCLGDFVFQRSTTPYQTLNDEWAWRHPESARVGATPVSQYAGRENDKLKLSGELYPGFTGGIVTLKRLRDMADTGEAHMLIDGLFNVIGEFVIERISVTRTEFLANGAARRIEFNLELKRVENDLAPAASGQNAARDAADKAGTAKDAVDQAIGDLQSALGNGMQTLLSGQMPDLVSLGAVIDQTALTIKNKIYDISVVAVCAAGAKIAIGATAEVQNAITGAISAATGLQAATINTLRSAGAAANAAATQAAP
ncbi:MAG: phage tail protein [Betaproteobacteria bacterium]|nr:phage tail protein [Betaproteobacteria bacterium]